MSQSYGSYYVAPGLGARAARVSSSINNLVYKHSSLALSRSESWLGCGRPLVRLSSAEVIRFVGITRAGSGVCEYAEVSEDWVSLLAIDLAHSEPAEPKDLEVASATIWEDIFGTLVDEDLWLVQTQAPQVCDLSASQLAEALSILLN